VLQGRMFLSVLIDELVLEGLFYLESVLEGS
jgi:hypothetical protein